MSRRACCLMVLMLCGLVAFAQPAGTASYFPLVHAEPSEETLAQPGATVYLFHSGTADVRAALHVGDSLTVIRIAGTCESVEVGKVQVVALVGDTYLRAEVVSGAVKPNDIARDGSVSCLVLAAQPCDRK